jgi:hypothetical protein
MLRPSAGGCQLNGVHKGRESGSELCMGQRGPPIGCLDFRSRASAYPGPVFERTHAAYLSAAVGDPGDRSLALPLGLFEFWALTSPRHCQVVWREGEFGRVRRVRQDHEAVWAQVSCRQTRRALVRAHRYSPAVIRCRRGRKWP